MHYEIPFIPVSWKAHKGYGKRAYSPRAKEKDAAKLALKLQHAGRPLYDRAIRLDILFEMPIPPSMAKKLLKSIDAGEKVYHTKRPDLDNLRKFASDTLIGTVLSDDALVCAGETQKYYSKTPKTVFFIQEL